MLAITKSYLPSRWKFGLFTHPYSNKKQFFQTQSISMDFQICKLICECITELHRNVYYIIRCTQMLCCLCLFHDLHTSYVTLIRDVSADLETKQKRVYEPRDQTKEQPWSLYSISFPLQLIQCLIHVPVSELIENVTIKKLKAPK
jgi:hypothetical protein